MPKKKHVRGHVPGEGKVKPRPNFCFGCGKDNPQGMRLKFVVDADQRRTTCTFRLSKRYQGPPGHTHGGIITVILDEAMSKVNKLRSVIALTKRMEIEFLRPVPLGVELTAVGYERGVRGRKHRNVAEIRNAAGEILARGTGLFIAVDAAKMFAKFAANGR
jgi:uncharacterized protein (TIGR00369 family)